MINVSTKGRYALRLMIDLALHGSDDFISLKDVANRQNISLRYLEQIIAVLLSGGLVQSRRGKTGGYCLTKSPEEYTTEEILSLTEGATIPLLCLSTADESPCPRAGQCATRPFWQGLQERIDSYLKGITLKDLADQHKAIADKAALSCDYGAGI